MDAEWAIGIELDRISRTWCFAHGGCIPVQASCLARGVALGHEALKIEIDQLNDEDVHAERKAERDKKKKTDPPGGSVRAMMTRIIAAMIPSRT